VFVFIVDKATVRFYRDFNKKYYSGLAAYSVTFSHHRSVFLDDGSAVKTTISYIQVFRVVSFTQNFQQTICTTQLTSACYLSCLSHCPLFYDHRNNLSWRVQIMTLFIILVQFPVPSFHFPLLSVQMFNLKIIIIIIIWLHSPNWALACPFGFS
jgi:hypothetical protein